MEQQERMDTSEPLMESEEEEEAVWREVFNIFDINGDGCISVSEFAKVIRGLGYNPSLKFLEDFMKVESSHDEMADQQRNCEMVDQQRKENEQKINWDQFTIWMRKVKTKLDREDDLMAAFRVFDSDNNGFIDKKELIYILTQLGEKLSEKEIEEMYKAVDINSDDKIDYKEFSAFCNKPVICRKTIGQ